MSAAAASHCGAIQGGSIVSDSLIQPDMSIREQSEDEEIPHAHRQCMSGLFSWQSRLEGRLWVVLDLLIPPYPVVDRCRVGHDRG